MKVVHARDLGWAFHETTHGQTRSSVLSPDETFRCVWSPDRTKVVYTDPLGGMYSINVDGTQRTKLSEFGSAGLAWSPNSDRVAHNRGTDDVYVTALTGERHRLVVGGGQDLCWSPDGRWVAYTRRVGCRKIASLETRQKLDGFCDTTSKAEGTGVFIVSVDDGTQQRITNDEACGPVWSPNSTQIGYTTCSDGVWVVDVDTGKKHRVDGGDGDVVAWSPNGRCLAVAHETNGLKTVNLDGSRGARQIVDGHVEEVAWSPNSQHLAYTLVFGDGSGVGVFTVNLDGSEPRMVTGEGMNPVWTLDSENVLYSGWLGTEINTVDLDTRLVTRVGECPSRTLMVSPGARHIAYLYADRGVTITSADQREQHQVATDPAGGLTWSPNGEHLCYTLRNRPGIWACTPEEKRTRQLSNLRVFDPKWGPDSNRIAYHTPNGITVADVRTGKHQQIVDGECNQLEWSPVGGELCYTLRNRPGLWACDAEGKHTRRLTNYQVVDPKWAPDSNRVAYHTSDGVVEVDVCTGKPQQIVDTYCREFTWTPDSQLCYTLWGGGIYTAGVDGSDHQQLSSLGADGTLQGPNMLCSPDHQLVFSNTQGMFVINLAHPGEPQQIGHPEGTRLVGFLP